MDAYVTDLNVMELYSIAHRSILECAFKNGKYHLLNDASVFTIDLNTTAVVHFSSSHAYTHTRIYKRTETIKLDTVCCVH